LIIEKPLFKPLRSAEGRYESLRDHLLDFTALVAEKLIISSIIEFDEVLSFNFNSLEF